MHNVHGLSDGYSPAALQQFYALCQKSERMSAQPMGMAWRGWVRGFAGYQSGHLNRLRRGRGGAAPVFLSSGLVSDAGD
jgi:hypothetical protein